MSDILSVGSLFSGIGGIDLGLERAGMKIAWQVEIDEFCLKVLRKHWPEVPKYGDIRKIDPKELEPVDLIAGGFPCQPVSIAGKKLAQKDERWLWPEFARIIRMVRPKYVLVENVPGLLCGRWEEMPNDRCLCGWPYRWRRMYLSGSEGGQEEALLQPKDRCGHEWAFTTVAGVASGAVRGNSQRNSQSNREVGFISDLEPFWQGGGSVPKTNFAISKVKTRAGRVDCLVVGKGRGVAQATQWYSSVDRRTARVGRKSANEDSGTESEGANGRSKTWLVCPSCGRSLDDTPTRYVWRSGFSDVLGNLAALGYDAEWFVLPASTFGAPHKRERIFIFAHPPGPGLERCWESNVEPSPDFKEITWESLLSESAVIRKRNGVPYYVDRIRGLGNAVVPQLAEVIGKAIMTYNAGDEKVT